MSVAEGGGFLGCRGGKAHPWVVENTPKTIQEEESDHIGDPPAGQRPLWAGRLST